jgi:hypothetical protein
MRAAFLIAAALGALAAGDALAGRPALTDLVVSEARDGPAKSAFKPNTAKVYIRAKLVDVPAGAKLKAEWIAVKVEGAPPNYKMDEIESTVGKDMTQYHGAYAKPTAGWPVGTYRIDLSINGTKVGKAAAFSVAK